MRLLEYLKLSCSDENTNKFRALTIGLCDKVVDYTDIIEDMKNRYNIEMDVLKDINTLNKELKKYYSGNMLFCFCVDEDINIRKAKIGKNKDRLHKLLMEANDKFSDVKLKIEKRLAENI